MSVYTPINKKLFNTLLAKYSLGQLYRFDGIRQGITNTIYLIETSKGKFIFTLFENMEADELPYFIDMLKYLHEQGFCCPCPIADNDGEYIHLLREKPCLLTAYLPGSTIENPSVKQCAAVGKMLANLHLKGSEFPVERKNPRGIAWEEKKYKKLQAHLSDEDLELLQTELTFQQKQLALIQKLPAGLVHADLFRDNVLFDDGELSGVVDFFYACNDCFLLDVAIAANDWCMDSNFEFDRESFSALINAYQQVRPFTDEEIEQWNCVLRAATLRFWVSRLHDMHFPPPAALLPHKNPHEFKSILLAHIKAQANEVQTFSQLLDRA